MLVDEIFVVKEFAVLGEKHSLSLYFRKLLSIFKIRKILRFLIDCEASWIAMGGRDDPIQHSETVDYKCRDRKEVNDDDNNLVYVKEYEKREWL